MRNKKKFIYPYNRNKKVLTLSEQRSMAGSVGAASRWQNHEKKFTKLVRMYTYDYDYLHSLSLGLNLPVVVLVHRCIQHIRVCHGPSALRSTYDD